MKVRIIVYFLYFSLLDSKDYVRIPYYVYLDTWKLWHRFFIIDCIRLILIDRSVDLYKYGERVEEIDKGTVCAGQKRWRYYTHILVHSHLYSCICRVLRMHGKGKRASEVRSCGKYGNHTLMPMLIRGL